MDISQVVDIIDVGRDGKPLYVKQATNLWVVHQEFVTAIGKKPRT